MEFALIFLVWTLIVLLILVGFTLIGYLGAKTKLAQARTESEKRYHS